MPGSLHQRHTAARCRRNLKLARSAYDAWNRGDEQWFLDRIDDDFVLRFPPGFLVLDELYCGVEGWRKFWRSWRGAWEAIEIRIGRLDDLGGDYVLAIVAFEGGGRESGAPVRGIVAHRATFRDGRFVALIVTPPGQALEAAGLRR
jgi:ketosteroid isomerase-like protein